jgi:SAM-dependent methyltransferase
MGSYTAMTRAWLERRYARAADGSYWAHEPVYGLGHPQSEPSHPVRLARLLRVLQVLDGLHCRSLLDVGGSEGWTAALVRDRFGAEVATVDLSVEACRRARELFDVDGIAADGWRLPFADAAFDVVLCCEVVEHVEHPVEMLLELQRVARTAVVLTTEELHHDREEIDQQLFMRTGWPHEERNLLHPDDVRAVFGERVRLLCQCDAGAPAALADVETARRWLLAATERQEIGPGQHGVVVIAPRSDEAFRPRSHTDVELVEAILHGTVGIDTLHPPRELAPGLAARLRCPVCRSVLRAGAGSLVCARHRWPVRHGVPDFVDLAADPPPRPELQRRVLRECGTQVRADAVLALRDRLLLEPIAPRDEYDFAQLEQRRGFRANQQLQPRPGGSAFAWRCTGDDPQLWTPRLDRALCAIELEMRLCNPDYPADAAIGQVFWAGPGDDDFVEARSRKFALANDGAWHTVCVELAGEPRLPAVVSWLRLDLANGPGEIDLRRLKLR